VVPSLLADAGLSHKGAIMGVVVLNIGGISGSVLIGRLSDKRGAFAPLIAGYGIGAVAIAGIGVTTHSVPAVLVVIFMAGFCVVGAQLALAELSAKHYPTYMRSTGVGWAMGLGRTGSAIGPIIGGMLLAYGLGREALFLAAAVPAALAAGTLLAMSFNVPPRKDLT
jgi:AAHS family 4-hydroxybenzoate transporter-like MFS transporter